MPDNTADSSTLREFLKHIQDLYGTANRTWIMDQGIPTENSLEEKRDQKVNYLVCKRKRKRVPHYKRKGVFVD